MRHMPVAVSVLSLALLLGGSQAQAETKSPFTPEQKAAIEEIVKNYLTKDNPEVVMTAIQELQGRERANADKKTQEAIKTSKDSLYNNADLPVGGNPKGDVTIVEFFDYQCGYCKMAETAVEKLLGDDKNVKFIYVNYPILGPASKEASKAALAARKQDKEKALKFHNALMALKDHPNTELIMGAAKEVGLDAEKLKTDMAGDDVEKMLKANLDLGNKLNVRGTPMFIIGDKTFPGAIDIEQMKSAVAEARTAKKK